MIFKSLKHNSLLDEQIYIKTLPNGLKCYIIPKKGFVQKQAVVCVDYGSADTRFVSGGEERETPAGVAHFIEHKMFDKEDGDAFGGFAKLGGSANAFTNFTNTAYYFNCADHFEDNLKLLLDLVQTPYFTDKNVEKEKGIITQEIRMYRDNPFWTLYMNTLKGLYSSSSVLADIAGTEEDVGAITKETLYDCYEAFYHPRGMALICVGDIDAGGAFEAAAALKPRKANKTERVYAKEPEKITRRETRADMPLSRPMFSIGFKDNDFGGRVADRITSAKVLIDLICGESSDFFNELYGGGAIDGPFAIEYACSSFYGMAMLNSSARDPRAVFDAVISELERVGRRGLDPERLELIRRKHIGRFVRAFDSVEGLATGMVDMFSKNIDFFDIIRSYKTLSADYLEKRLARLYTPDNCTLSAVYPLEAGGQRPEAG